jgi:ribose transport system permease protein
MTLTSNTEAAPKRPVEGARARPAHTKPQLSRRLAAGLAFDRVGAVYVWLGIIVLFSLWVPDTFPSAGTAKQILNSNAITGLAALSITIPLAARVFDLSFAGVMTLTGVAVAHFLAKDGIPLVPAVALALAIGLGVGLINAIVVVVMRIDSFIGTLATGSLITALITMVTNETPITDAKLGGSFAKIGQTSVGGVTLGVFYCAAVALAIWYLLEHTATGRRLYATGFNPDAARLAGVRVDRLRFMSLVASGGLAGAAGVVLASTLGSGSPTAGSPYLLPAFAAAFLGATQLKHGRFNAGGTIIAVLLLGTGVTGLALANAPSWAGDMFVGVVLIAALAVTGMQRRTTVASRRRGLRFGRGTGKPEAIVGSAPAAR